MTQWQFEERAPTSLRPDPANREMFDPLAADELAGLVTSIRENGLVNPISIMPDGLIIAGEQRWRAALAIPLDRVSVLVLHDPNPDQVEALRIEENVHRRVLKPTEWARAIKRLYEIKEVTRGRPRAIEPPPPTDSALNTTDADGATQNKDDTVSSWVDATDEGNLTLDKDLPGKSLFPETSPLDDIASATGLKINRVQVYKTLADLHPALGGLLDAGAITQRVGYQLAQLPDEAQAIIAAEWGANDLRSEEQIKELRRQLQAQMAEADNLRRDHATSQTDDIRREKDAEIERVRQDMEVRIAEFRKEQEYVGEWVRIDHVHKAMMELSRLESLETAKLAERIIEHQGLRPHARLHLDIIDHLMPWLAQYSAALRDAMGLTPNGPPPSIVPFNAASGPRRLREISMEDTNNA